MGRLCALLRVWARHDPYFITCGADRTAGCSTAHSCGSSAPVCQSTRAQLDNVHCAHNASLAAAVWPRRGLVSTCKIESTAPKVRPAVAHPAPLHTTMLYESAVEKNEGDRLCTRCRPGGRAHAVSGRSTLWLHIWISQMILPAVCAARCSLRGSK